MGVTGLWTVVSPCARPIKLETLNKKRLAVDASIWIYQFLKAVRDKEGHALRNSHVVGFFRRICKLLFFGIKPVFVFDGGAPALKRQTISTRKLRREGRREDATRTASKLLALQMQRLAEDEGAKRKRPRYSAVQDQVSETRPQPAESSPVEEETLPENMVYVEQIGMSAQERQKSKPFKRKDQYHLPELDVSLAEMGGPNDPRVMSIEELEQYARQFDSGEDINVYDFSKIDFDSPFFMSLPPSDRYNILNAARLRSRLRMGYSKEQLDTMFPDRMAFSRFQIERVKERNELTQRLMNINGMGDAFGGTGPGRVAGERGREYVLVRNDGVEGGWALGVIGDNDKEQRNKPIDVDALHEQQRASDETSDDNDGDDFEDIPIEGLNRLPKLPKSKRRPQDTSGRPIDVLRQREEFYSLRRAQAEASSDPFVDVQDEDTLFVNEDVNVPTDKSAEPNSTMIGAHDIDEAEDSELQKAIAMSLEPSNPVRPNNIDKGDEPLVEDEFEEVFGQKQPASPVRDTYFRDNRGSVAKLANARSLKSAPKPVNILEAEDISKTSSDDDDMDLNAALARPRKPDVDLIIPKGNLSNSGTTKDRRHGLSSNSNSGLFDGPLPFEKLDLGTSLLGKKKKDKIEQESAGGFEKDLGEKKKTAEPLPPWFSGEVQKDLDAQKAIEDEDRRKARQEDERMYDFQERPKIRDSTPEIIDVDEIEKTANEPVPIHDDEVEDIESIEGHSANLIDKQQNPSTVNHGDSIQAKTRSPFQTDNVLQHNDMNGSNDMDNESEKEIEGWDLSESEKETDDNSSAKLVDHTHPISELTKIRSQSSSPEFEDVAMSNRVSAELVKTQEGPQTELNPVFIDEDGPGDDEEQNGNAGAEDTLDPEEVEYFPDDSDDELIIQLSAEADEHARFASTLNKKTPQENLAEYERELKALRTQQKKDRRDADEVTQVMITECQQLLQLFGLPYITAPMEAEAQCAELVTLGLVDGIVTDDSDIFLFGGTRVYKNMFNQAKFVECYLTSDLEREFDLTRDRMIRIAHLLGSDYTEGIPGVGPVTALEIISEFPGGLKDFKEWWTAVQQGTSKAEDDNASTWRRKFKKSQLTKLFLSPTFPDLRVDAAYLKPDVDADPQPFQWGIPDLDRLRAFLMATIGWSQERTDEVLVPVIKDMNRREQEGTQSNITNFLGAGATVGAGAYAPRKKEQGKSRRMETALEKMAARAREKRKLPDNDDPVNGNAEIPMDERSIIGTDDESTQSSSKNKQAVNYRGSSGKRAKKR